MKTRIVVGVYDIKWDEDCFTKKPPVKAVVALDIADVEDAIHNEESIKDIVEKEVETFLFDKYGYYPDSYEWSFA